MAKQQTDFTGSSAISSRETMALHPHSCVSAELVDHCTRLEPCPHHNTRASRHGTAASSDALRSQASDILHLTLLASLCRTTQKVGINIDPEQQKMQVESSEMQRTMKSLRPRSTAMMTINKDVSTGYCSYDLGMRIVRTVEGSYTHVMPTQISLCVRSYSITCSRSSPTRNSIFAIGPS